MTREREADAVRVAAPARLHLGFLDPSATLGRRFGGVGIAIDAPQTVVRVEPAQRFSAEGPEAARAAAAGRAFLAERGLPQAVAITIEQTIPSHAGLGSGTQLTLAVIAALARLNERQLPAAEIAKDWRRHVRSGVGVAAFDHGGLIVDGGKRDEGEVAPMLARLPVARAWRILLVGDPSLTGVHGAAEVEAFRRLPDFPAASAAHLCHLTLMRLLPAVTDNDLAGFGSAVSEMQAILGDFYTPVQGGRWTSPAVGRLCESLGELGAMGIGQSSWGPTGFAFVPDIREAQRLRAAVLGMSQATGLTIDVVAPRNEGARIEHMGMADAVVVRRTA